MVLGGEYHIFHTRILCSLHPFFRSKLYRVKSGLQVFISFYIFCHNFLHKGPGVVSILHLPGKYSSFQQFPIGYKCPNA